MRIATFIVPAAELELAIAELYGFGTEGVQETELPGQGIELQAWFPENTDLGWLERFVPKWADPPDVDWTEEWRSGWEPLLVGERLYIVPDWRNEPTPEGRLRLVVHPAQASGSGYHAPTQLALEALETAVRPGDALLDVGTGSGILSRAALLLGAEKVIGCDIDEAALVEARDLPVFVGSARAMRSAAFDCVTSNVNAEGLLALREDLVRVARPGGRLVVAGFKTRRLADVREAFGLPVLRELVSADWRCLVLRKPDDQASK